MKEITNKKAEVAVDMAVNIVCFTIILLFAILYWALTAPTPIKNAAFSGDAVDISAEQFTTIIYKTPTIDGTVIDSIKKYIDDVEIRGEDYAKKKLLRKFLPENTIRNHKSDWMIKITEADTKNIFEIKNPYYDAVSYDFSPINLKYYHTSTPINIQHAEKTYTIQTYYVTGSESVNIIEKTKMCSTINKCRDYKEDENSCNEDPCYITSTSCTFITDEEVCKER